MKLLLRDVPQGHGELRLAVPAGELNLAPLLEARGEVVLEGITDRQGDLITIRGEASVEAVTPCARCTTDALHRLRAELIVLADQRGSDHPADESRLEEDGSILYHDGIELPLAGPVREALILEEPLAVLCRDDCRGLCPRCGADRNTEPCSCDTGRIDARWSALEGLQTDPPGGTPGDSGPKQP